MRGWLYPMNGEHPLDGDRKTSGGKGAKGGNPFAQIRFVKFSNDIKDLGRTLWQPACAARAWRKPAETGGNWRKLAETLLGCREFPALIGVTLAETAELPSSVP
jgi:hypothetical protein